MPILLFKLQVSETEGATLAASHSVGFCEVSVADNSPNLYKIFEKLLIESRTRPLKPRKFSVSKMIGKLHNLLFELRFELTNKQFFLFTSHSGTLIGNNNNGSQKNQNFSGTVVVCNKAELHKSRLLKRRQAFTTATASL